MDTGETNLVFERMSGIASFVYEVMPSDKAAGYVLLAIVFLMSAIVFKLGFAKKLPLLKNVVIYLFLFIGCLVLTFLALFLPIVEGLLVAASILIIYRIRRINEYKNEDSIT